MQSFTATVNGKDEGPFETFGEAAKNFFGRVIEKINTGAMTRMTLETSCWIQGDFDEKRIPMLFDDAKELAYNSRSCSMAEPSQIPCPPSIPQ